MSNRSPTESTTESLNGMVLIIQFARPGRHFHLQFASASGRPPLGTRRALDCDERNPTKEVPKRQRDESIFQIPIAKTDLRSLGVRIEISRSAADRTFP